MTISPQPSDSFGAPRRPTLVGFSAIRATVNQAWKQFGESPYFGEFLYRFYDADHHLVYVGITWKPFDRWREHARKRDWFQSVVWAEVWLCYSNSDARHWESRCIKEQLPRANIHQRPASL